MDEKQLTNREVNELLSRNGEHFVHEAYAIILGRTADPEGLAHHMELLNGTTTKLEILRRVRASEEGCKANVSIPGLGARLALLNLQSVPVIGVFVNLIQRLLYGPTIARQDGPSPVLALEVGGEPAAKIGTKYRPKLDVPPKIRNASDRHAQLARLDEAICQYKETLALKHKSIVDFQPDTQSPKVAAVIAHFDSGNCLDDTFLRLLSLFTEICHKVVLVTTCDLPHHATPRDPRIVTICRPNVGYDFYSYKVGIEEVLRTGNCKQLFLVNSSFVVLNAVRFAEALQEMSEQSRPGRVVGVTESVQFERHLQSYLLLLDGGLLERDWFRIWLANIQPMNSKMEAILAYELGMSRELRANGVELVAALRLSEADKGNAASEWVASRKQQGGGGANVGDTGENFNPVHFVAQKLASEFGIAKSELLRSNPHERDLRWLPDLADEDATSAIDGFIAKSKGSYRKSSDGLTVLDSNGGSQVPSFRLVQSGPLLRLQVKIAVVVHIFYTDLIEEIFSLLSNIVEPFDLFVTTPFEESIPLLLNTFVPLAQTVAIAVFENRGRDMGPFVALHRSKLLDGYAAVLKIHSKHSRYSEQGGFWRQKLYSELCGSYQTVRRILDTLSHAEVGIVGPHEYYLSHAAFWGGNLERVRGLLISIGAIKSDESVSLGFFGGSMFWFKPCAIRLLHDIPDTLLNFEAEAGQRDATLAHAFERIFCNVAKHAGYYSTSLRVEGADISTLSDRLNTVPVLQRPPVEV